MEKRKKLNINQYFIHLRLKINKTKKKLNLKERKVKERKKQWWKKNIQKIQRKKNYNKKIKFKLRGAQWAM